jgi:S1-C subfamily serine protease
LHGKQITAFLAVLVAMGAAATLTRTQTGIPRLFGPPTDPSAIGSEEQLPAGAIPSLIGPLPSVTLPGPHPPLEATERSTPQPVAASGDWAPARRAGHDQALGSEELVAECGPAVAIVRGKVSSGSGFLVAPRVLATNAHVIAPEFMDQIEVHFPSAPEGKRGPFTATLLLTDQRRDLAFLSVPTDLPPLDLAEAYTFRSGQEIIVIGSPGFRAGVFLPNAVNRGLMSTLLRLEGQLFYQVGVSVNPGNSGGPMLDMSGQVLGVVTMKSREKDGIALCVPLEDVRAGLKKVMTQDGREVARSRSRHRAGAVNERLTHLTWLYLTGLDAYQRSMESALAARHEATEGLSLAVRDLAPKARDIAARFWAGVEPRAQPTIGDPLLSEAERNWTYRMWTLCAEARQAFNQPRPDFVGFRTQRENLHRRFEWLMSENAAVERPVPAPPKAP